MLTPAGGGAVRVVVPAGVVGRATAAAAVVAEHPTRPGLNRHQGRLPVLRLPPDDRRRRVTPDVGAGLGDVLDPLVDRRDDLEAAVLDVVLRLALERVGLPQLAQYIDRKSVV